nr:PilC/PilY family type IV pilus protein [uncultured Dethiosulfovibrio sp.]
MSSQKGFSCRVFTSFLSVGLLSGMFFADVGESTLLKGYPKLSWGLEDVYVTGYPPNVLLLIDTGSPMIWTPQGKMPSGKVDFKDTPLGDCTYGDGSRPSSTVSSRKERYGRDLDPSNNDINDDNNYYNDLIFRESSYSREKPKPSYTVNDLIPNDSRLYKLKLVLWRLLESKELVKDMNLGLATFWQQHIPNGALADWYKVSPYEGGPDWAIEDYSQNKCYRDSQNIKWGVMINDYHYNNQKANKARLRIPIKSTSDSSVISDIKKLIDGEESSGNDELRADGKAPLARSIYSSKVRKSDESNGDISGTAWHFFNSTPMGGICQTNWLVILTAGDDNLNDESPVEAVKALYRNSKNLNGETLEYPIRTLVIGFVDPNDDSTDVVKLRDTLNRMAFYGMDSGYDKDGNPREYVEPSSGGNYALFANDVPGLIEGFSRVFATIQSGRFGSNAPIAVRTPGVDGEVSAVVPYYTRKGEGQWHGDLCKEDLENGLVLWSAESQLPTPADRALYTVAWDDRDKPSEKGVTNLSLFKPEESSNQISAFSNEMGIGNSNKRDLRDFIGWLRGYKNYGYGDLSRREHVLFDMEHSGLSLVGPPGGSYTNQYYLAFKEDHKDRLKSIYIQSNSGMLHCFDEETGRERWAFVPPNVLHSLRIASLRFSRKSEGLFAYSTEEKSLPLYLLDGPVAVGDVRDSEGNYHTVLVGFLGRGGAGMYAMDITDPIKPRFLWAMENAFDVDKDDYDRLFWTKKNSDSELGVDMNVIPRDEDPDFSLIGFTTTGPPAIGMISTTGGDIPAFILSGGVGLKKDSDIGKAIYVVNALTGEIVHSFVSSWDNDGVELDLGTVLSPAVAYSTRMRDRTIEGFFCADSAGSILQGNTDNVFELKNMWTLSCPSPREGISFSGLANPLPLGVGLIKNDIWVFGGTSGMSLAEENGFQNSHNIIFSLNVEKAKNSSAFRDFNNPNVGMVSHDGYEHSIGSIGWFMPLDLASSELGQEYSTTSSLMTHGAIFIATYQKSMEEDRCSANGFAHIYALDPTTGRGYWDKIGKKRLTLEGLKIAGISVTGDKLILSVKKMKPFEKPSDIGDVKIVEKGDLLEIDLNSLSLPGQPIGSRVPKTIYWRELFSQ